MRVDLNFRKAVAVLTLFLILAGIHLFIYAQNISLKYQLTDLKLKLAELNSRTRALSSQAAREENLAEIEATARDKLGMLYPENIIYILMSTEAVPKPN